MFRRHHLFASLSVALVTAVCIGSSGCSDPVQSTPRVTFESTVTPGTHSSKDCGKTGSWFDIGSFGNPALGRTDPNDPNSPLVDPVKPVDDGGDDQQGKVAISCSVTADGDGFQVKAHAELSGATGGAVTISGRFTPTGDQTGISVALSKGGQTFSDSNCTATFDTVLGHAVAAGRVWANVDCKNAEYVSAQQVCASHAQFRFENCAQ